MTVGADLALAFRRGAPDDALCVGVLATQVFLDTYATQGIRPDLAREASSVYATRAFVERLGDPSMAFVLVEDDGHLVAFLEAATGRTCPTAGVTTRFEVVRLYVQRGFQHRGIGRALSERAQRMAHEAGEDALWLTAWSGNARALAFYRALGYRQVGLAQYVIEGRSYENQVLTIASRAPSA